MLLLVSILLSCGPRIVCGPGTHEEEGICLPGGPEITGELQVYILAGQSNMDGFSPVTGLPPSLRVAQSDVAIYWSGSGALAPLAPSSHMGAQYVGPEVTFGRALADAGQNVAIVKHAVSGTSLAEYWSPGDRRGSPDAGQGWTDLVGTMSEAAAELDATGRPWRWAGFLWMQGETDAQDEGMADAYGSNLADLVARVREETGVEDLPVVVGVISDDPWPYAARVREAQEDVARDDPRMAAVETLDLTRSPFDDAHYDGPSMRILGRRFAAAVLGEEPAPLPVAAITYTDGYIQPSGDRTAGWRFTTDRTIWITDIGTYSSTFLKMSQEWGLWEEGTGTLLARGAVPNWFEAPTSGRDGFWYTAIEPMELPPGDYILGTAGWSSVGNDVVYSGNGEVGPAVTFVEGRAVEGYWLSFPKDVSPTYGRLGLLGPGFLYVEEP